MKSSPIIISVLSLLLVFISFFYFKRQQPKIAYVESTRLLTSYHGMTDVVRQYQKKASVWQANIDTLKAEFQQALKSQNDSKDHMSAKELELSTKLIESKQKQLIDYQQTIKVKMSQEDQKMTQDVLRDVNAFIKAYGKKKGYTIIFSATDMGNIIYAEDALNITDKVIKKLNSAYDQ